MPATDNKYPITYDGVDPSSILPSFDPYEGYPIKRTSSASDLSCVAIVRGDDEHPYVSSTIATNLLAKVGEENPSLKKTGLAYPVEGGIINGTGSLTFFGMLAAGEHYNQYYVASFSGMTGGFPSSVTYDSNPSNDIIEPVSGQTYGAIISLDEVFYAAYIKGYIQYQEGVYYPPMGRLFGGFQRTRNSKFTSVDGISQGIVGGGGCSPANLWYKDWSYGGTGTSMNETKWINTSAQITAEDETNRMGAVEGWHAVPSVHRILGVIADNNSQSSGQFRTFQTTAYVQDNYKGIGIGDSVYYTVSSPSANKYSRLLLVYATPYRPRNPFTILRYDGTTYNEETLEITQSSQDYEGQATVNLAKEVSVSPNGKYILLATESTQGGVGISPYTVARVKTESLYLFRHVYVGPGYTWRNAFLSNGLVPTIAQAADTIAGRITPSEKLGILSCGSSPSGQYSYMTGQFSSVAVTNTADWFVLNNQGYVTKSQMTAASTRSEITAPLQGSQYPCAPIARSKNGSQIALPTAGQEIGGGGSPTIAIAVSNNGVVVKADRNVSRGFKRIPISGASGSSITLSQNHGLSSIETNTYVAFDINQGGSLPSGSQVSFGRAYSVTIVNSNTLNLAECTFSSPGTSAYLIIYDGDGAINRSGQGGSSQRSSNFNLKSYQNNLYATVTIDGQSVLASSPVGLETARYGAFGSVVAINEDGDTVAVSSPSEGHSETSGDQPPCEGAVYIYKRLQGEGGGQAWAQVNRITVPRILPYQTGLLGFNPHLQFGSSLEFSGTNLLIGSRQGVYIYELSIGLYAQVEGKTTIVNQLSFATPLELASNTSTGTPISAVLSNCTIPLIESISARTQIVADLQNPVSVDLSATISTGTTIAANLTFARKVTFGTTRLGGGTEISPSMSFLNHSIGSNISSGTSLAVTTSGGAGITCKIECSGSYVGSLIRYVNIQTSVSSSATLKITDDLLRINPYLIESSTATATSIVANLGYVSVELSATLYKSTSIVVSAAKLVTLGTSDARQANIFEVGKASSATIGGLGQRWIKRSDLQNSDLTTSVEWVEGQPPQLD
jgi:hypothetical protein